MVYQHYDAIVVLGNRLKTDGSLGRTARARVEKGVELLQDEAAPILLLCGGRGYSGPRGALSEAGQMRAYAVVLGAPEAALMVESRSHDTIGNAYYARRIAESQAWQAIRLVTSDSHMQRALYILRHIMPSILIQPDPTPTILSRDELDGMAKVEGRAFKLARVVIRYNLAPMWCLILSVV